MARKKTKSKKKLHNQVGFGNSILIVAFFCFVIIALRGGQLALSEEIDGINLKEFASYRTTATDIIPAKRGTIYDINGNILAQNVYSYTLIAYLDASRTTDANRPKHVVDVEMTAEQLAPILGMEKERIIEIIQNAQAKNAYQTEFGSKGRGLTELVKSQIQALQLPGIDFIETQKRYYPNGNFLSYTIGYAKNNSDGTIVGEMGLESYYNETLSGVPGSITYQKDLKGYQIANTPEIRHEAIAGKDIYLTIDDNIQFFIEQAIKNSASKYTFERINIIVAEASTGRILGMSTYPSFDPNVRDISVWEDPLISTAIEPGSTMKIYSYMAAMESGNYNGQETFKSGVYVTKDGTEIGDHDRRGWGYITFDRGFALSSNVGALTLVERYMSGDTLRDYYLRLGFGGPTGIELPNESNGKIAFRYETEIFNAAFGQGVMTTPIQNVKALTSLSNDGVLLQPYLVDRIVDPVSGDVIYEGKTKELGRVASEETVTKMISLMHDVVTDGTGTPYYMEGYDIAAKTGTAQISDGNGYLTGESDVIRGFAGLYPGNDPEYIIYATVTKPSPNDTKPLSDAIKEIIKNIAKYKNMETVSSPKEEIVSLTLDSYYSRNITKVVDEFNTLGIPTVVIGDGDTIINQYPKQGTVINSKEKVYFVTNGKNITLPDLTGWSHKEVSTFFELIGYPYTVKGTGYVTSQSVKKGTKLDSDTTVALELQPKFDTSTEKEKDDSNADSSDKKTKEE